MELLLPGDGAQRIATTRVIARLQVGIDQALASQAIARRIEWPDLYTWVRDRKIAGKDNAQLVADAVTLIDRGERTSIEEAKRA